MNKIPAQYRSLKFLRAISWNEIFDTWREGEALQESWKKHWEERGFESWDEWRRAYVAPLKPDQLEWSLYAIEDPIGDLPEVYGVPARSWIDKAYGGAQTRRYAELTALPIITENDKVKRIKNNFPSQTMLTGLIAQDKIILVEGAHRAAALASWDPGKKLDSQVTIALAAWDQALPVVGGNWKK